VQAAARVPREATGSSPEDRVVARAEVVSWLRADPLAFPTAVSGLSERIERCPLQWRGRTGITPVSVSPTRVEL